MPDDSALLVALINACFKADVNNLNNGYVAPPDEDIDGLLDDGLSKHPLHHYEHAHLPSNIGKLSLPFGAACSLSGPQLEPEVSFGRLPPHAEKDRPPFNSVCCFLNWPLGSLGMGVMVLPLPEAGPGRAGTV